MIKKVALVAFAAVVLLFYAPFLALGYYMSGGGVLKLPSTSMLATTFMLALVTAAIAIALAYPAAYYLAKRGNELEFALLIAPLWVGTLLKAYSLLVVFSVVERFTGIVLWGTALGVVVGMVYEYFPYAVLTLYAAIEKLSETPTQAARVLGASRAQTFLRVELPLTMPGVVAAFILIFLFAMGEVIMPAVLGAWKVYTVGSYIWDLYFKARDFLSGSVLSLLLAALSLLATYVVVKTIRSFSI
ncbi:MULTISPECIES: ABC transporter permease [Pyrobaculum]|uniref:Binding-protein-dependent transport systems inner membrane component n=2 Tax=Pyrobaculum arsenaticum TaxID=121277 RepID=A4WJI8_PYRAR|nr:ABC transporter permease [Pyrobaculum arsenaticum]ABP50555.1 binding-protein-dependent transport systems inner membrane component [Pyrobaculum arsenaticum DSM 13514]MCY0890542.1 ABC transporter permease [Pyrobaculum arsenaticum]NYR14516.1 ABC transporter permease [Pyrobaculum arsenaticum]